MKRSNPHALIAVISSLVLVGISAFLAKPGSTYQWSFVFLAPLVWAVYFLREKLALLPSHFALFAVAIIVHDLGSFGFYNKAFLGLRFDTYVHFGFGLVAGLVLFHAAREKLPLSQGLLALTVPLFIVGIGGVHEMFECFTTILLGPEKGMLKMRPDQPFDTQKDLLNNLLGGVLAVLTSLRRREKPEATQAEGIESYPEKSSTASMPM